MLAVALAGCGAGSDGQPADSGVSTRKAQGAIAAPTSAV
jgi:hypothetical protein